MNFDTIKNNFDRGLWTANMVRKAVQKGVITPEEFTIITDEPYSSDDNLSYQEALNIILGNED